jgi:co-chaperonin GroES (HSP10)
MTATLTESRSDQVSQFYPNIVNGKIEKPTAESAANFRPHPGTVLVVADPPDRESKGGIIIPEKHLVDKNMGTVVAAPDLDPLYAVGDRVLFRSQNSEKLTMMFDGKEVEYVVLQYRGDIDDQILGKFVSEGS